MNDYPKLTFTLNSPPEVIHSNISEEEFEEFKKYAEKNKYSFVRFVDDSHVDMRLWRALRVKRLLEQFLISEGKNPTEELLVAATDFIMKNGKKFKLTTNPVRKHWFFELLCDICDGKESIECLTPNP